MLPCSRQLLIITLLVQLLFAGTALAASELEETLDTTQAKLEALAASSMPDTEKQELQELYQNTIDFLQKTRATEKEQAELQEQLQEQQEQQRAIA